MEFSLDEQKLVADFRRLNGAGKKELLDYVDFLLKKQPEAGTPASEGNVGTCPVRKAEERPEAAKEPIFTE
jgi:hypothetical protein